MLKNLLLFSFVLLLLWYYIKINHKSKNLKRHKNTDSLYAHYSKIDTYNYLLFPKLLFASPIYFKLEKGQCIFIPKNWWHWIKTTKKSFAINYWFNNENNINDPFIFNTDLKYNINILNNEKVDIWLSNQNDTNKEYIFSNFYNSGKDYEYLITLSNYNYTKQKNLNIKNIMKPYISCPVDSRIKTNKTDYNIWVSSGKHDTGLHYDDEDGILHLIEGEKDIILFPPSDTKYLYPYEISYDWLSNTAYDFRYNSYKNNGIIKSKSSSQLLYETSKHDKKVLSNISKLFNVNNKLVWGFKNNNNEYRWEFYNYTLDKKISITSYDIFPNENNIGDIEHHYYNNNSNVELPFWGYGKYKKNNILYNESEIFVIDNYDSFSINYSNYMDKLKYNEIKDKYKEIILNKYKCYELCIHNKNPNQIFIQYLGISNTDFLNFLINNNYPKNIIDFANDDNYNINNEITIVYDIDSTNIIRTGFYGII